jgi:hypothetical protein
MSTCFLTAAERSDPQLSNQGCSPKENLFFPAQSGKRRAVQTLGNVHFLKDFLSSLSLAPWRLCVRFFLSGRVAVIAHRDPPTPPDMPFSASGG